MSPLERAEKALRDALLEQSKEIYFYDNADRELFLDLPREWDEFEGGKLADRFDLSAVTRAVLEALRAPSERMEQGGAAMVTLPRSRPDLRRDEAWAVWQAMIDAALGEGQTSETGPNPPPRTSGAKG